MAIKKSVEFKLSAPSAKTVLLAGDFNTDDKNELSPLTDRGMQLLETPGTCPSWEPTEVLDHIFINKYLKASSVTVPDVRYSDHLPVRAVLNFCDAK